MPDIRYNVDVNTSGMKQAANDFDAFKQKISDVMGVTDPQKVEQYWDEYNSGMEENLKLQNRMEDLRKKQAGTSNSSSSGQNNWANKIFSFGRTAGSLASGSASDAVGAGLNAGGDIFDTVGKLWQDLPLPAKIAMGGVGGALAVGYAGNAVSKQYENVAPQVMSTTAALEKFGSTATEQSKIFHNSMKEITVASSEYGYKMVQGAQTIESISRGGARVGDATRLGTDVMRMSRSLGYSAPIESLAGLASLGSRFGVTGNIAEYAMGGAMNTVGSRRTDEQAQALLSIMQGNIAGGVSLNSRNAAQMAASQNWLYGTFGERAAGMGGASLYQSLSGAQSGATSLGSTGSLLLYRAARQKGEDYTSTMGRLESGFSPAIFDQFRKSISGMSEPEKIETIRQAYGVNYLQASDMLNAKSEKDISKAYTAKSGPGAAIKDTTEVLLNKYQEQIAGDLRNIGTGAAAVKVKILGGVAGAANAITNPVSGGGVASGRTIPSAPENMDFSSLINAESAYTGKGGDVKNATRFLADRYGYNLGSQKENIGFISTALQNKDFVSSLKSYDPNALERYAGLNKKDKQDWSTGEISSLKNAILSDAKITGYLDELLKEAKISNNKTFTMEEK